MTPYYEYDSWKDNTSFWGFNKSKRFNELDSEIHILTAKLDQIEKFILSKHPEYQIEIDKRDPEYESYKRLKKKFGDKIS